MDFSQGRAPSDGLVLEWYLEWCLSVPWGSKPGGGGETRPRSRKISWERPPRNYDISVGIFFLDTYDNFAFSTIFK